MAMFVDELCKLCEAGQGLRRAAWPNGRYLRLVDGEQFGYVLIEQIGFEEFNLGWWRLAQCDLAACDWYLELRHTV
jgi:hypothetical protein